MEDNADSSLIIDHVHQRLLLSNMTRNERKYLSMGLKFNDGKHDIQ